jgi:hypothetical protein
MQIVRDLNTIFSENVVKDSKEQPTEQLGCSSNEVPEQREIHVGDVADDDVNIVDPLVHDTSVDMEKYDGLEQRFKRLQQSHRKLKWRHTRLRKEAKELKHVLALKTVCLSFTLLHNKKNSRTLLMTKVKPSSIVEKNLCFFVGVWVFFYFIIE